ncbi:MAG: hypothetical protein SPI25_02270 [Dialister sp.]|nr:hypothetical protein [Dialister sp.]
MLRRHAAETAYIFAGVFDLFKIMDREAFAHPAEQELGAAKEEDKLQQPMKA